jgi:hypothetical protein
MKLVGHSFVAVVIEVADTDADAVIAFAKTKGATDNNGGNPLYFVILPGDVEAQNVQLFSEEELRETLAQTA